jgi:hypothetical protein
VPCRLAIIDGRSVQNAETGVSDFSALGTGASERRTEKLIDHAFDLICLNEACRMLLDLTAANEREHFRYLPIPSHTFELGRVAPAANCLILLKTQAEY